MDDAAEQQWLWDTFGRMGSVWLGFTDQATEGTWAWSSGAAVAYTNWAPTEPQAWAADLDYAYQVWNTGRWATARSGDKAWGLIELAAPDADADGLPDGLDPSPADPLNAWDLRAAGPDAAFATADDVLYRLTLLTPYPGGTTVTLTFDGGPLADGTYRFTATARVTDRVGNPLDGNGDGTGGDAYQRTFTVTLPPDVTFEGPNNNTLATATPLPLTEDPAGSGLYLGRGLGRQDPASNQTPWADPDYWQIGRAHV